MSSGTGTGDRSLETHSQSQQTSRKRVLSSVGGWFANSSPKKQRCDDGRARVLRRGSAANTIPNTRIIVSPKKRSRNSIANDENTVSLPEDENSLEERVKRLRIGTVNKKRFFITSFVEQSVDTVDVCFGSNAQEQDAPDAVFNVTINLSKRKEVEKHGESGVVDVDTNYQYQPINLNKDDEHTWTIA